MNINKSRFFISILFFIFLFHVDIISYSQSSYISTEQFPQEWYLDKCAYDEQLALEMLEALGPGWGYNYDSLLIDLNRWRASPFIMIDSVGASVQNRALWRLTITDTTESPDPRIRISIHARTHPSEVQATWVTNEIIKLLISDLPVAQFMRQHCIFNIVPMYNPDGVELGNGRTNANGVDLEQEWDKNTPEPEAATLKRLFTDYMASASPIRVALNMHSSSSCKRYFVYHHPNGTSTAYAEDEKYFIGSIRKYWPEGFENWNYYISWTTGAPTYFPESWFWINFREAVMALTYEDMACQAAGQYDRTAAAMIEGIADYLGIRDNTHIANVTNSGEIPTRFAILETYPNPVYHGNTANIRIMLRQKTQFDLALYDILGKEKSHLVNGLYETGQHDLQFCLPGLSSGIYFICLKSDLGQVVIPITVCH